MADTLGESCCFFLLRLGFSVCVASFSLRDGNRCVRMYSGSWKLVMSEAMCVSVGRSSCHGDGPAPKKKEAVASSSTGRSTKCKSVFFIFFPSVPFSI